MKNLMFPALAILHTNMILRAKADETGSGETELPNDETGAVEQPTAAARTRGQRFTPEQIKEIRDLRALKKEDGKPVHSHAALAKQFDTTPGAISHIVRNRNYKDEFYVPVNDGK